MTQQPHDDDPEQARVRALLADLPAEAADAGLVERVMAALPERRAGPGERLREALFGAHELRLRWNLASAIGAAALLLLVASYWSPPGEPREAGPAGLADRSAAQRAQPAGASASAEPQVITAALRPQGAASVLLVVSAPGATSVAVAGDFNQWQPDALPMRDDDRDGVWSVQVSLVPGRYEYMFVIDGREWRTDPLARAHRPDGFGRQNAVLEL